MTVTRRTMVPRPGTVRGMCSMLGDDEGMAFYSLLVMSLDMDTTAIGAPLTIVGSWADRFAQLVCIYANKRGMDIMFATDEQLRGPDGFEHMPEKLIVNTDRLRDLHSNVIDADKHAEWMAEHTACVFVGQEGPAVKAPVVLAPDLRTIDRMWVYLLAEELPESPKRARA